MHKQINNVLNQSVPQLVITVSLPPTTAVALRNTEFYKTQSTLVELLTKSLPKSEILNTTAKQLALTQSL